jgi:hypothetical protein
MSAQINWDFAVERHKETMTQLAYEQGREEVDRRCEELGLSPAFKRRLIAALKGDELDGTPY